MWKPFGVLVLPNEIPNAAGHKVEWAGDVFKDFAVFIWYFLDRDLRRIVTSPVLANYGVAFALPAVLLDKACAGCGDNPKPSFSDSMIPASVPQIRSIL